MTHSILYVTQFPDRAVRKANLLNSTNANTVRAFATIGKEAYDI